MSWLTCKQPAYVIRILHFYVHTYLSTCRLYKVLCRCPASNNSKPHHLPRSNPHDAPRLNHEHRQLHHRLLPTPHSQQFTCILPALRPAMPRLHLRLFNPVRAYSTFHRPGTPTPIRCHCQSRLSPIYAAPAFFADSATVVEVSSSRIS